MLPKKGLYFLVLLLALFLLSACALQPLQAPQEKPVDMANPAAVFCEDEGYTYEIRTAEDGSQTGACVFDDGRECDDWAFFRGECQPGGE